jgi:hypothetical protein
VLAGTVGGAPPANADGEPKPLVPRRLFDQSRPGSVGEFIRDSETAISQGRDQTPREVLGLPLARFAAAVAVLALLLGVLVPALARRRRRTRRSRDVPGAPAFEARQGPIPAMRPSPPLGTQAAVEQGDWWPGHPLAPVGPVGHPVSGGTAAGGGDTIEPPAQTSGQPAAPLGAHRPPARHDWWQREWPTAERTGPAEEVTAGPAHPPHAAAVTCWRCGYASPPTGRFCEQCWSVLRPAP